MTAGRLLLCGAARFACLPCAVVRCRAAPRLASWTATHTHTHTTHTPHTHTYAANPPPLNPPPTCTHPTHHPLLPQKVVVKRAHDFAAIHDDVEGKIVAYANRGFRALGIGLAEGEGLADAPGTKWDFIGLVPLFDPPRHDTKETIERCQEKGINVKMVTGDQQLIGIETAKQLGMGTNIYKVRALCAVCGWWGVGCVRCARCAVCCVGVLCSRLKKTNAHSPPHPTPPTTTNNDSSNKN